MQSIRRGSVLALGLLALVVGACGSSDVDGLIGPNGRAISEVQGTVRAVDTSGTCAIELDNASASDYRLRDDGYSSTRGGRATVYCDDNTRVVYQGRTYRPQDLERGDEVVADVAQTNGRLVADRIDVTVDVSSNPRNGAPAGNDGFANGGPNGARGPLDGGRYGNRGPAGRERFGGYDRNAPTHDPYGGNHDLRGTVRQVDTQSRTITLERVDYFSRHVDPGSGRGEELVLYYDASTRVMFGGQSYRPENLEPGDLVAIAVDDVRGTLVADQIDVVADAHGAPPPG